MKTLFVVILVLVTAFVLVLGASAEGSEEFEFKLFAPVIGKAPTATPTPIPTVGPTPTDPPHVRPTDPPHVRPTESAHD